MDILAQLNLLGDSPAFLRALDLIRRFAACEATVLLQGETGTDREEFRRGPPDGAALPARNG